MAGLLQSDLKSLPLLHRGKVRDIYAVGTDKLLVVQTDRLSAFDVILDDPIPNKGKILTEMSNFWFGKLGYIIPNQITGIAPESVVAPSEYDQIAGRSIVVKKLKPLAIEAIVRGYLIGSGWKEYKKNGTVCGNAVRAGMREAEKLDEVLFTPSTKAPAGEHDENITYEQSKKIIGEDIARQVRDASIRIYSEAAAFALERGIIIADTKFEFGLDDAGVVHLIDEVLTPDSSRFWPVESYRVGSSPASFDKQYVRDWLEAQDWNKQAPAPRLPKDVLDKTASKYAEALRLLAK